MFAAAVEASQMMLDPANSVCASAMGMDCCDNCDGDDKSVGGVACLSFCSSNACAVIASGPVPKIADQSLEHVPAPQFLQNRATPPDPFPPIPFYLV